MFTDRKLIRN